MKKNLFKKAILLIASLGMLCGCQPAQKPVERVFINEDPKVVETESQFQFSFTADPKDGIFDEYTWEVNDPFLGEISDEGLLTTYKKTGFMTVRINLIIHSISPTTITNSVRFEIKQKPNPVSEIKFDEDEKNIGIDESFQLNFNTIGKDSSQPTTTKDFIYESGDNSIATISDSGLVKGVGEGYTFISVTANDELKASASIGVRVKTLSTESIDIYPKELSIEPNQVYTFNFTTYPRISKYNSYKWTVGNPSVGTIDEKTGVFQSEGLGETLVSLEVQSASTKVGKLFDTCLVKVVSQTIDAQEIKLETDKLDLEIEDERKIKYEIFPSNSTTDSVTFISRNPTIVGISNDGFLTANGIGSSVVDVFANDVTGVKTSFTVNVSERKATSIRISRNSASLIQNSSIGLKASVYGGEKLATRQEITWESDNTNVAEVNSNGLVTAAKDAQIGSACKITATSVEGGFKSSCLVEIIEDSSFEKTKIRQTTKDYTKNNVAQFSSCPTWGDPKVLIVPVWFTNSNSYISNKEQVRQDIISSYIGSNEETGWRSVRTYYSELSNGKMNLTGTVTDWFETNMSSYECDSSEKSYSILKSAVKNYFTTHSYDAKKNYDTDKDGYFDAILLIYAAPDSSSDKTQNDNLWGYCSWSQESPSKDLDNPNPNVFFWASYDFMYSKGNYALERTGKSNYGQGDTSHCILDAHCFIHEMGHVLGLLDYYDYSSTYSPAGGFSMQDQNVGSHDPYSVMSYGWADPFIPTESCTIQLNPFQSTKEIILLTPEWNFDDSPYDEYLLLELYTPTGLNQFDSSYQYKGRYPYGSDEPGIRLWHVDARLIQYKNGYFRETPYTDTNKGNIYYMMSNSYGNDPSRISYLGQKYVNYNILQLIRNNENETFLPKSRLSSSDLFKDGDSFDMRTYAKQFVDNDLTGMGLLNSKTELGWSFSVSIIRTENSTKAIIDLVKE